MESIFVGAVVGLAGLSLFRNGVRSPGWWIFIVAANTIWFSINA